MRRCWPISISGAALAGAAGRRRPRAGTARAPSYARLGEGNRQFQFYAAWPVESTDADAEEVGVRSDGKELGVCRQPVRGGGTFVVIGDTHFASNENFDMDQEASILFWRWLLSRVVAGQEEWNPPPAAGKTVPPRAARPKRKPMTTTRKIE